MRNLLCKTHSDLHTLSITFFTFYSVEGRQGNNSDKRENHKNSDNFLKTDFYPKMTALAKL